MSRSRLNFLALSLAAALSAANGEDPFSESKRVNPNYNQNVKPAPQRKLKGFTIKGVSIQAYNRKDAIKRFNHLNKK